MKFLLLLSISSFPLSVLGGIVLTSSANLQCGRNPNYSSSLGSPEWSIDPSCPELTALEWRDWSPNASVIAHSGKIHPTQVSEVIVPGRAIHISSNHFNEPQLQAFTPASTALVAACFNAIWGPDYDIICDEHSGHDMRQMRQEDICIYSENLNLAGLFQHYYINTTPTRGLGLEIHKRFYPNATMVAHYTQSLYREVTIERFGNVPCPVTLFVTPYYRLSNTLLAPPPSPATWDCYWYGSFEYLRQKPLPDHWRGSAAVTAPGTGTGEEGRNSSASALPHLFVYVDRERRTIQSPDNHALRLSLQRIATQTGLRFHFLGAESTAAEKANIFSRARVVVAVHGGALANMIFMSADHASSLLIIEIQPISGERRFCFLCMAYGLRLGYYGVYFEEQWDQGYSTQHFPVNVSRATDWIHSFLTETHFIKQHAAPEGLGQGGGEAAGRRTLTTGRGQRSLRHT